MSIAIAPPAAPTWPTLSAGIALRRTLALVIVLAIVLAGAPTIASADRSSSTSPIPMADVLSPTPAAAPPPPIEPRDGAAGHATWVPPPWVAGPRPVVSEKTAPESEATATEAPRSTTPLWQRLETSYTFDVRLAVRTGAADVVETLDVRNPTDEPLSHVNLSVLTGATGEFRLVSVARDGRAVPARWTNDANLEVDLDPALADGLTRLVVAFQVHPSDDTSSSLATRTSIDEGIVRFGGWFPIVSDGHGFRPPGDAQVTANATFFRLNLDLDRAAVVAAPGDQLAAAKRQDAFELRDARDFAFAVSERFITTRRQVGGVSVEAYTLRGAPAAVALRSADRALTAFSGAYGPYPYQRFLLVQSPRSRIGNEYPGMAFLGVESLADPVVVAHETAHQWFYGLVGNDQIQDPWLDEALAEFAATDLYGTAEPPCEPGPVASPVTAFPARRDTLKCGGYGDTVYRGGAALVASVRARLGKDRFDDVMRTYVEQNTGRIATTDDLVGVWLSASDDPTALRALIDKALFG
jgi:hypothetical protein